MGLRHLLLALCALSSVASLASPAQADQQFWTYSTAPIAKPAATPTYSNIGIEYLYDPCASYPNGDGRFNPYDTRSTSGHMHGYQPVCQGTGHHRRPGPPRRRWPAPPPKRIPLARHT